MRPVVIDTLKPKKNWLIFILDCYTLYMHILSFATGKGVRNA